MNVAHYDLQGRKLLAVGARWTCPFLNIQLLVISNLSQNKAYPIPRYFPQFFDVVKISTSITSLNMTDARLDQFGLECLCGALKSNSSIITVNISENYIGEEGAPSQILIMCISVSCT